MDRCNPKNLTNSLFNDSCSYVRNSSLCVFDSGFLNYYLWQYCDFDNRIAPTILMFGWFIILLLAIAVTADSFFAPCLVVVTKILRMSQNLAGVTLLALGNGAADVFSSLSAVMSATRPNVSLAIGSIIGAGILVNTITAGIIMIITPFTVMRRPIIKDLVFYMISLLWCVFIFVKRKIELWSSIVFLAIYISYVLITGISRVIYVKRKKFEKPTESLNSKFGSTTSVVNENQLDKELALENAQYGRDNSAFDLSENMDFYSSIRSNQQINNNSLRKNTTISDKHKKNVMSTVFLRMHNLNSSTKSTQHRQIGSLAKLIMEKEIEREISSINKNHAKKLERQRSASLNLDNGRKISKPRFNTFLESRTNLQEEPHVKKHANLKQITEDRSPHKIEDLPEVDEIQRQISQSSTSPIVENMDPNDTPCSIEYPGLLKHFLLTILPVQLEDWSEQSLWSKIFTVIQSPFMFILTLTIPVIDDDAYLRGWCKILNCLHCITSPVIWVVFINVYGVPMGNSDFLLIYLVLILGVLGAVVVALTSLPNKPPCYFSVYAFVGFITSIIWIYEIANEIVNILETFGLVLSIPQTILGLSVLAFANSIGDLVSNIALAKNNFPRIAYAACIGGPLFNLLVGIGLPFTIATITNKEPIELRLASEVLVLITTILLITTMNLIALPWMKFQLKPFYGVTLILIYVIFFILVMLFASRVINVQV